MKSTVLFVSFILFFQFSCSNSGKPLKGSNKMYLHGSSILIGNNILGHHRDKPLMDDKIANDMVKMKYIDIDEDNNTFSSSAAFIGNAPQNTKIAYAALYWSALYPFNKGVARRSGNKLIYKGRGKRDGEVNSILFKRPKDSEYMAITGDVIYDSFKEQTFEDSRPYVCYADVTAELQELSDINGSYTVANVLATEGQIPGGGSAGWLLYIVYEDESESLKYFTTYDGLLEVNRDAVEIGFKDFKSKEDGDIHTTIALGAMEGDRRIKTDELSIYSVKSDEYIVLSTQHREENNFFNSSITIGDELFLDRVPNSSNTLGFDLLKMEIPNDGNKIFDNSTTQAKLKFETKADRFYLHFVAFETEISQDYFARYVDLKDDSVQSEILLNNTTSILGTDQNSSEERGLAVRLFENDPSGEKSTPDKENKTARVDQKKEEQMEPRGAVGFTENEEERLKEEVVKMPSWQIPELEKGYYLVVNVFADPDNAQKWTDFLREMGYEPRSITNPANNWDYIFIAYDEDLDKIVKEWFEYREIEYFEGIWVMKVNFT